MLNNISKKINLELQKEQDRQDFYMLIHEDTQYENFIDDRILNLNENGVNDKMLKNEMPFLFIEDTVVDDELVTNLQNEIEYEDNFEKKPISDNDETTELQEPKDFDDNFSAQYASDADADTDLTKEVDYNDNQKTPVNIDEFSNEAADLLFEMGDILGAMSLIESEECDGTNLTVDCPDEGDVIPQADEADVEDTEEPEGYMVEEDEEMSDDAGGDDIAEEDFSSLEEEFNALFEDSDEDDSDDDDDEDDSDEDDEKDDDKEECDDEDCEKSESVSILDWFE